MHTSKFQVVMNAGKHTATFICGLFSDAFLWIHASPSLVFMKLWFPNSMSLMIVQRLKVYPDFG